MGKIKPPVPTSLIDTSVDLESVEARKKLALMLMKLFSHWQLDQRSQLNLLGMSEQSRSALDKYRKGDSPLPKSRDMLDRAGYLLAIHKALRILYPHNPQIRYSWINHRNKAFDNLTPLDVMQSQGVLGAARVARYLDFVRGQ
ncbi:antitoxin Xre/MbcA/ParS toxin-binding domain-containing protein [Candidatus Berkiella aquae]|uniref:DUF2384 domain-containing protein n=1 Tax=Candidatus Berkiella aquae TaxID=295108 RepID=A0A0Q9YLL2_9GAMM|nr:antitoxin Xre/MbcA/ParS toxin-binding domain-containing protein [Candidatus Berkiella aquae]MCS5710142.1 DUF2384 domain-containing protein [Candidatus Berkiella aquae]